MAHVGTVSKRGDSSMKCNLSLLGSDLNIGGNSSIAKAIFSMPDVVKQCMFLSCSVQHMFVLPADEKIQTLEKPYCHVFLQSKSYE